MVSVKLARRRAATTIIGIGCLAAALIAADSAAAATDRPKSQQALVGLISILQPRCQMELSEADFMALKLGKFDFDGDAKADLYVDVPPSLLIEKGCAVDTTRVVWLSSDDFAPGFRVEKPAVTEPVAEERVAAPRGEAPPETNSESPKASGASEARAPYEIVGSQHVNPPPAPPRVKDGQSSVIRSLFSGDQLSGSLLGGVIFAIAAALAGVIWAAVKVCQHANGRYGCAVLLNWWNLLYLAAIPVLVWGAWLIADPGAQRPALALLTFGGAILIVRLIVNVRQTDPLVGPIITLIQPIALVTIVFAVLALRGAIAPPHRTNA